MSEAEVVDRVLQHFECNRRAVNRQLIDLEGNLYGHVHGFFCFRWRQCRRWEQEARFKQQRNEAYLKAEHALKRHDYQPAVDLLDEIAADFYETPTQQAWRIFRVGFISPFSLLDSPGVLYARLIELRDDLAQFLPQKPDPVL